jgi:hypothetical protein
MLVGQANQPFGVATGVKDLLRVQCFPEQGSTQYSGALLIRTPLIQVLHHPDDISGEQSIMKIYQM